MMWRRKSWPATACMPSRQLAGYPPRPRSSGWSPSSWLACSPHYRWAHLGDGGSPAGVVAVVGHVRPDLAGGPVDLHAAHHPHQRPSRSAPNRAFNRLTIEGSAQRRRAPVGVRYPSRSASLSGPARKFVRGPARTLGLSSCNVWGRCVPPPGAIHSASGRGRQRCWRPEEARCRPGTSDPRRAGGTAPRMTVA
jgi:hypothetical protein